jgi:L-iditol 2-dehydrogenase
VIEPDERRRALACGHAAPPDLVDVAIVAAGAPEAYLEAFAALAPRGRLVVFSGLLPNADDSFHVSLNRLHYYEHTVVGAYGCAFRHGEDALELLGSGRLRVDDLVSHRLPLRDLERGLDIVARRAGMKVHLYPDPALFPERSSQ